jgi:hypothetical protein
MAMQVGIATDAQQQSSAKRLGCFDDQSNLLNVRHLRLLAVRN